MISNWFRSRAAAVCASLLLWSLASARQGHADQPLPLIDQEPFDRITLTPDQKCDPLLVFPLADEGTEVPANPKPVDTLRLRLIDYPDRAFETEFRFIAKIERFEEVLLAEAKSLVDRGAFEEAFTYYQKLQQDYPELAGLSAAVEDFLLRNAAAAFKESRLREAMGLLLELQHRNPQRRELQSAVQSIAAKLFQQDFDRQQYAQARSTMEWVQRQFPKQRLEPLVRRWQTELEGVAEQQSRVARTAISSADWRAARRAAQCADAARPNQPTIRGLLQEINDSYPVLVVGVWQTAPPSAKTVALEWSSRRIERLLCRPLVEQTGFGTDGGRYGSPWGAVEPAASGDSVRLRLDLPPTARNRLTAFDVSRRFLDRRFAEHSLAVREFAQVTVVDPLEIEFKLRHPTLRPEYWLTEPPSTTDDSTASVTWSQPYRRQATAEGPASQDYQANDDYLLTNPAMFREIQEIRFEDPGQLVRGLIDGELDVVARVHPADVRTLQRNRTVTTVNYASPTLHFLLPNFQRSLPAHRTLRRGLLYCLDRDAILTADVLSGANVNGARVLNGPFPCGASLDDPLAYAVDTQITTRSFDPLLGLTLYRLAASEVAAQDRARRPPTTENPEAESSPNGASEQPADGTPHVDPLRILYPDQARARVTVEAISRYWSAVGIPVATEALEEGRCLPHTASWDFCYVELVMTEPLYDVHRLLGELGLVPEVSPYLRLALRRVRLVQTGKRHDGNFTKSIGWPMRNCRSCPCGKCPKRWPIVRRCGGSRSDLSRCTKRSKVGGNDGAPPPCPHPHFSDKGLRMSHSDVIRLAVWSGPRNISTALMRAWGSRPDTIVCDEPLYAHYLSETGKHHPGREATLNVHDSDWRRVAEWLTGPLPSGKRISYQKHMAHHVLPSVGREWMAQLTSCFLIRHPRDMLISLSKQLPQLTIWDTGLPQQVELFERTTRETDSVPCVIDARDVLTAPEPMLRRWCDALQIDFDPQMLTWSAGPRDTDGAWGPFWYQEVYRTTAFAPPTRHTQELDRKYWPLLDELTPLYDRLYRHRLSVPAV